MDLTPYYVYRNVEIPTIKADPYTREMFLKQVYMTAENYDTLIALLKNKKKSYPAGSTGSWKDIYCKETCLFYHGHEG